MRHATRQIRIRLPQSLGGLDPALVPPRVRRFELDLPRRAGGGQSGPSTLRITAPGDYWVPKRLQQNGLAEYEPETLACFLAAVEHARPGAVLDIGANVGVYAALAAARSRRKVYAFEPTPQIAETARAIAADNDLDIEVVEIALSNHSGTDPLRLSATTDASNSLAAGFRPELGRIPVTVDMMSHWREEAGIVPSVLKIDTEATEPDVIAGGLEVLRRFRPWVFCEVMSYQGIDERLMALLEPLHYHWYHLTGVPPYRPRQVISGHGAIPRQRMWLFAPEPVPDRMWDTARAWREAIDSRPEDHPIRTT
ncbi:MAG: FkbM family methyltransferase [Nocardiopsaceae bacterium]|nr:FkbM family methyltransferase [Nocardiopsaceae bacterium]